MTEPTDAELQQLWQNSTSRLALTTRAQPASKGVRDGR